MSCTCNLAMLYWIKDAVWQAAAPAAATRPGGHLCIDCAGKESGRPLTLHDLSVANYLRTAPNMPDGQRFMKEYTRATIIGALRAAGMPIPQGWTVPSDRPHVDAVRIGEQLGRQTIDPQAILLTLVLEVDQCFP